jgi:hypothetical protein
LLKDHFSDPTIFTIAHPLEIIIDYDRILIVNAVQNPESLFYELCMNAGKAQFDVLPTRDTENAMLPPTPAWP